jgi:simple sugar transport system ATP-binding protein
VHLDGADITGLSPRRRQELGIAHIAADRHASGFVPSLSVADNLILPVTGSPEFSKGGALRPKAIAEHVGKLVEEYDIRVAGPHVQAGTLSGGNQQRLVLARELSREPRVVLSCFATRGLDFASTEAVHQRMRTMRAQGAAIAYASVDLDELLTLTDRILVLHEGRVAGLLQTRDATSERLGLLMGGSS